MSMAMDCEISAKTEGFRYQKELEEIIKNRVQEIYSQREEVLEAFIAKYGFEPDRLVQCEQKNDQGLTSWFVYRRTDEQMTELSRIGANL